MSKGLAFYAELESQRLEKELANGWQIEKINWFGFYQLKKIEPEDRQIAIDFYSGEKGDIEEYLSIYEASGWQKITSYRHRYFIFKAEKEHEAVYTDEESFTSRINSERVWFMLNAVVAFFIGLTAMGIMNLKPIKEVLMIYPVVYLILSFIAGVAVAFPIATIISMIYYKVSYGKRTAYFKKPEDFARKQSFKRDSIWLLLLGFIAGILLSVIVNLFF